jgi:hypothetical protein
MAVGDLESNRAGIDSHPTKFNPTPLNAVARLTKPRLRPNTSTAAGRLDFGDVDLSDLHQNTCEVRRLIRDCRQWLRNPTVVMRRLSERSFGASRQSAIRF